MRRFLFACAVALVFAIPAKADDLRGTFRTEPGNSGGFLHVVFAACEDDPAKTCGVIEAAFDRAGNRRDDYPHLGRRIIWGMVHDGRGWYSGGRLWSKETDRVLRAKLRHVGDRLNVSGCVGPVCRAETWERRD